MQRSLISLAILTLIATHPFSATAAEAKQANAGAKVDAKATQVTTQLPRHASPTHYALSIAPDAEHSTFSASVTIALDLREPSTSLTLNAADLEFASAAISAGPGQAPLAASAITTNADQQTVTLSFARELAPGSYQLQLDYHGKISTQPAGLFQLDYQNGGAKKRALYTQFENSDARRVLPCWDEPNYKATFALELTAPAGQSAISNMPLASSRILPDGRQLLRFATTPRMSTYLLFFSLGEFDRATTREGATELGVVTQKGKVEQARFVLDASAAVLREYNDYFGLPYPLPKLDNVAAPGRSPFFGAMENWGAIFSFENAMLLDPAISTQADKEEVFMVAAHEIAHQWFGDLVTMRWWDDLWLNEGFASWMESRTTARLHPEWQTSFNAVDAREHAMAQDALSTTHPIVTHIETVEQANQAFDGITYQKGESVIRMLENYVGEDAWRAGVRDYMRRHAHGNTVSDDLWRAIETAAHKPVRAIAHDFTLQPGVPLIRVQDAVCRNGSTTLTLAQGEFSKDHPDKAPLAWQVPVIAQTVGHASARAVVSGQRASMTVPGCGTVLVNAGQAGYYRTLYAPKAFDALAGQFASLAPIDQLGLLADSWSLGMAGLQPASSFLDLASRAPLDAAPPVWSEIAGVYTNIDQQYQATPQRRAVFGQYARAHLSPVLARIGWEAAPGETTSVAKLRTELIDALSALGDAATIAEARRRFDAGTPQAMPTAIKRTILGVVARHADAATWERLHQMAKAETSALLRTDLYLLLGASEDAALGQRALDLALSGEPGATDSAGMISRVAVRHPELAFDYAASHREQVEGKIDVASRSRYFPHLASMSADPAMMDKLTAFAQAHLPAGAQGDTTATVAAIAYRIKVRQQRLPQIDAWLARKAP
ncbi:MAG TPA: M1 family metallopeptidase [Burkholderiaceae bacterium]|nr:M1 family metallopeptidase [Burkholderiaceae bacterium]